MSYHTVDVVSTGNSKLGEIPNVSLRPGADCPNCSSCIKTCYALKAWNQYPNVKKAWTRHSELLRSNIGKYQHQVESYLAKYAPEFFRIHSSGDFISQEHFNMWVDIATDYPEIKFLAFTKSFEFLPDRKSLPENLSIVLSLFPTMEAPDLNYPIAYAGETSEYDGSRVDAAIHCPGQCDTCGMCWDLSRHNLDVRFSIH